jgi:glycosyltransferase involved in cell wall biosynthesis
MKKISVVIAAYNKAELTVRTVQSVLDQAYGNLEVIVIDDGSTDNTRDMLLPFFGRIKYVYKKNGGASSARNLGIKLATGDLIAMLDCDDIYMPEKIEKCAAFLEANPEYGLVYTKVYFIDKNGDILREYPNQKPVMSGDISNRLILGNFIPSSTVIARKKCFEDTGLFDESIFVPADWDMWLKLSEKYKVGYIGLPLTKYNISGSYTLANPEQSEKEELEVLKKAAARNKKISPLTHKKSISELYLRSAVNYLLIGNFSMARKKLMLSLRIYPLNRKSLFLLFYHSISPQMLQRKVKAKIFFNRSRARLETV